MANGLIKAVAHTFLTTATAAKSKTAATLDGATTPTAAIAAGTNMKGFSYSSEYSSEWSYNRQTTSQSSWDRNNIYRFGTAIGAEKSQ